MIKLKNILNETIEERLEKKVLKRIEEEILGKRDVMVSLEEIHNSIKKDLDLLNEAGLDTSDASLNNPKNEEQSFQKALDWIKSFSKDKLIGWFNKWYEKEKSEGTGWADKLPDCPCSLKKTNDGFGSPDESIWTQPSTVKSQKLHPGAAWEIRSKEGQQCCYDKNGALVTTPPGAGTADKASPSGFVLNALSHFNVDVLPYAIAVMLGGLNGEFVRRYIDVRPPNNGLSCKINKGGI